MSQKLKEKITSWVDVFNPIKDLAISIVIVASTFLVGVAIFKSTVTDSIEFEPLQIPSSFLDKGYTPQIATTRLIDEIRRVNSFATTTKARGSVLGPGEALAKIDNLPIPGSLDVKSLQGAIASVLGVQRQVISGEITIGGDAKAPIYIVRIRQSPENIILVDEKFNSDLEDTLAKVALKIVERIDPVVAASYYRNKKMNSEALVMIDAALSNSTKVDDTFALSQRAMIYKSQKNFELSKADLDRLLEIDPKSPQGLGVMSDWYVKQGNFDEALKYADRQIEAKPDMWWGYFNKAEALIGLQKNATQAYEEGLKHSPSKSWAYIDASNYLDKVGKHKEANAILLEGARKFPDDQSANLAYGAKLFSGGHEQLAVNYIKKAYLINPNNKEAQTLALKVIAKDDPLYSSILQNQSK